LCFGLGLGFVGVATAAGGEADDQGEQNERQADQEKGA
jgi:hypothetical protein